MAPGQEHAIRLPRPGAPERLRARQARIRQVRTRTVAIAVALFLALWVVIFAQLVTGHDPRLAASKTGSSAGSVATSSGSTSSGSSVASTGSGSSGLSSVTTQQS